MRTFLLVAAVIVATVAPGAVASAHSGGLGKNGGHYCREAGFKAKKCAPLNSYHCHRVGCKRR